MDHELVHAYFRTIYNGRAEVIVQLCKGISDADKKHHGWNQYNSEKREMEELLIEAEMVTQCSDMRRLLDTFKFSH